MHGGIPAYASYVPAAPRGEKELGARERTVHPNKYNAIFNVGIDVANRKIVNIPADADRVDVPDNNGT